MAAAGLKPRSETVGIMDSGSRGLSRHLGPFGWLFGRGEDFFATRKLL